MRRLLLRFALPACLAALAAAPAGASAATYVLRPVATNLSNGAWQPTPTGTSLYAALSDPAVQPAAPGTGHFATVTGTSPAISLRLASPSLGSGETPSSATLWVYSDVGANQSVQPGVWWGLLLLGGGSIPTSGPGWHSFALPRAPSASQLSNLSLALAGFGQSGATGKVYSAYLELQTTSAPQPAGVGTALPDLTGAAVAPSLPGVPGLSGVSGAPAGASAAGPAAPPVQIAAPPAAPAPGATAVAVGLACPADSVATLCRGVVSLRLLAILGRPGSRRATPRIPRRTHARGRAQVRDRCARGCRPIVTQTSFALRRGRRGRVRLRLAKTLRDALRSGHRVRALLTVTTSVAHGASTTTSRVITLRPR